MELSPMIVRDEKLKSPKSVRLILWGPWTSVEKSVHLMLAEIQASGMAKHLIKRTKLIVLVHGYNDCLDNIYSENWFSLHV